MLTPSNSPLFGDAECEKEDDQGCFDNFTPTYHVLESSVFFFNIPNRRNISLISYNSLHLVRIINMNCTRTKIQLIKMSHTTSRVMSESWKGRRCISILRNKSSVSHATSMFYYDSGIGKRILACTSCLIT